MGNKGLKQPTKNESRVIKFMILLGIFSILNFLFYFFQPNHAGETWLFVLLTITILYSILKKLYMWYNYSNISIPEKPEGKSEFKVDILTTYFPGEPYQMTITTLEAINNITYPHTTYLCDEANDPFLKQFCEENGIIHVTRDNRINAKAGNINNTLQKHATGDICVVLDPDHIPEPHFLDSILPHFLNPEIGFVQIVQSYYNIKETLVARGAAEQTFQFYGPMMMTLNAYGAVNAIGANCVFRRKALDSIGGHAPGLCEDMHTAMLLYSKGWKAIYVPEVLARGLAPSNLTSFFKQQIKWSRGTFDLLVKVYPRIFSKLSGRQKIHFGILPMHYLAGVICLINFLIPILSLLFSINPWRGNVIDFILVLLPVVASSILIRTYIQKWVIEKKERGFHIVGGLLHINSWWIYLLGLYYTIINKNVPYLPTPKENEWNTNYKIVIPNMIVAILSIFAIFFGLQRDLTPYSLIMAGFALFNSFIMIFGIYLAHRVTNQNRILRTRLNHSKISFLWHVKQGIYQTANLGFSITRMMAVPILLILLVAAMSYKNFNDLGRWENVQAQYFKKNSGNYLGIFQPSGESGLTDIQEVNFIENDRNVNFNIISLYLAWNRESIEEFPHTLVKDAYEKEAIPMITWEPWISELMKADSVPGDEYASNPFKFIAEGYLDSYIKEFIQILASYDKPIFLRYAHEFDNPQYPWSITKDNSNSDYIAAWKHIHDIIKNENAHKIIMVWNPWKTNSMEKNYPGDKYVDWIGLTILNYDALNRDGKLHRFRDLYEPIKYEIESFTRKPVMLAEFGSLNFENGQEEWLKDAFSSISSFKEISALVMFNSAYDKNIPHNSWYNEMYLDWTTPLMSSNIKQFPITPLKLNNRADIKTTNIAPLNPITRFDIKGVHYKKGKDWQNNYYVLSRNVLNEDFRILQEAGINSIQYQGSEIYDHNLIYHSKKFDLQIIYEFNVDNSIDFSNNLKIKNRIKKNVLAKVKRFTNEENIIGYTFRYDLENYFNKPLLFEQRRAYISWLNTLIKEIKKIDNNRPVVLEIALNEETISELKFISKRLPIDSYGLQITKETYLYYPEVIKFAKDNKLSLFISDVDPEVFLENFSTFKDMDIILSNWQDEWYSHLLSFNGLVDYKGYPKITLSQIKSVWTGEKPMHNNVYPKILRPAQALHPGLSYDYNAYIYSNGKWIKAEDKGKYIFEWALIKKDKFGNYLAIKELGKGSSISVQIPEKYKNYEILLTLHNINTGYSKSDKTLLHTPAKID